ncbi:MAG: hypothetical protein ACFFD4_00920 [Candidatus Odinarchaeota archaeon]
MSEGNNFSIAGECGIMTLTCVRCGETLVVPAHCGKPIVLIVVNATSAKVDRKVLRAVPGKGTG